ncbi:PIN domain-containing protein [uncultured Amnibacterium sp.]|uniref:PIN domain-containing protein n=1 Tax=uncultured Amnibacterium sp. TaxID=1631851 RepID=UPI0035CC4FED
MTVFDASALLAFLREEPGSDVVEHNLTSGGRVGAANWSEVAQKVATEPTAWPIARDVLLSFDLVVEPVTRADAEAAAALWPAASHLSLADRLCLALGARLDAEVLTADRAWADHPRVTLIR